jgi:long-chain acyl-CoA synthetase
MTYMYAPQIAATDPDRSCFIMGSTGATVTYGEFEARSNRLAHLLRAEGLGRLDHYSVFMENNEQYLETNGAGERSGIYYTCINSYLTPEEVSYLLNNSQSQILITSKAKFEVAKAAMEQAPNVHTCLVVGGAEIGLGSEGRFVDYDAALAGYPTTPIADESLGSAMLYSSGTTGQPKGILRPLPEQPPTQQLPMFDFLTQLWRYRDKMIYLSPAPLYHSAPHAAVNLTIRNGGTAIIMERFDPEHYLQLLEKYKVSHSQLVPTMFSRMLKLPEADRLRYNTSSLEIAIHAAAPCPVPVKRQMIEWWGPIVHEYYGATEGLGFTACDSEEWLAHPGTVGRPLFGVLHILDDDMNEVPNGERGTIWFETGSAFEYFDDPDKTASVKSPDGKMATVGDVGYVDADGFLHLTDRTTFMIISGGVNIYPQECENLLITHPKVADAAVFGVPNADLGEEVKAVVQAMPGVETGAALEAELMAFCHENLSRQKCPRSIDFDAELPRLPTGKLYKRVLRDRYWGDGDSRIL